MQCTKLKTYMETGRVVFIPPSRIRPNPAQPRKVFPREHLEELAASIRIHGILQPLSVRKTDTHYELIAGERRYRAAQLAGLREIPCIVMRMDEQESSLAALLENLQRQDLNFVEEAKAFSFLMTRFSMSQEQVAKAVGKSQSAVCNTLRLLRHSEPVLTMLLESGLTQRHGRALLKLDSEPQKLSAISHITRYSLSVSQTERYIETLLPKASPRLRCPAAAAPDEADLRLADRGAHCAWASSATGSAQARGPGEAFLSQLHRLIEESNLPITLSQEDSPTHTILTLHIPK